MRQDNSVAPPPQDPTFSGENQLDRFLLGRSLFSNPGFDDTVRYQLEPKDDLDRLELELKGLKFVNGQGAIIVRRDKNHNPRPYLNDLGVSSIMTCLRGTITKNNLLGLILESQARAMTLRIALEVNNALFDHWEEWDVDPDDMPYINMIVQNQTFIFLSRPVGGHESKRFTPNYNVTENRFSQPSRKLGGWFGGGNQQAEVLQQP